MHGCFSSIMFMYGMYGYEEVRLLQLKFWNFEIICGGCNIFRIQYLPSKKIIKVY